MPAATEIDAPPPPTPPSRGSGLRRSDRDRYLAGVAGGVGERFAVDPFFVRLALVVATLLLAGSGAPPLVAFAYAAAWLVLPEGGRAPLLARARRDGDARREVAVVVLLSGATALLLPRLGPGGSDGLRLGVALFGLAVLLLVDRPPAAAAPPAAATPAPGPAGTGAGTAAVPVGADPSPPGAGTSGSGWSPGRRVPVGVLGRAPRLRRPRREPALWPLTLSALALYGVVCVVVDQVRSPGLDPGVAASGALLVVGAVLLVSAWRGRARSTIVLGVALLPLWAGFTLTGIERYAGVGDRVHRPTTVAAAEAGFELGYGAMDVDLRAVPLSPGQEVATTVALTAGVARVRVPADARLVVSGDIGLGSISVNRYSRWDATDELVAGRTLDRRYGPIPSTCTRQPVAEDGLLFTNGQFASVAALDAELRRRGWPASRPTAPPGGDGTGDWVLVGVDEQWQLCDPTAPPTPADPATINLDVHLGVGTLEISRERPN